MSRAESKDPEDPHTDDEIKEPPKLKRLRPTDGWSLFSGRPAQVLEVCFVAPLELEQAQLALQDELRTLLQQVDKIQQQLVDIDSKLKRFKDRQALACLKASMAQVDKSLADANHNCQAAESAREIILAEKITLQTAIEALGLE